MTAASAYDYGCGGIIGIGTPQANPTVEAEMRILLPAHILPVTARLTSSASTPSDRLIDYLERLAPTLRQFDTLQLAAFGFACTGSSYLVEPERERALVAEAEAEFGCPIVTATEAIDRELRKLGASRIALVAPYPAALIDAATLHWRKRGYQVSETVRIDTGSGDTRSIYALGSAAAREAVSRLTKSEADAVLLSGTGMPSLALLAEPFDVPVISSNLCLARALCRAIGQPPADPNDWMARLRPALAPEGCGA